ncbi:MAG: helix-turn-helix domain-containing protein [Lachnospiraceae bacterium]|nr:helix-turn-helix domain-containing protein [Lachnospiraceae bacterium]
MTEINISETEKKVYQAEEIQKLLGIGRSTTYTFLEEVYEKQEPFRVIKIGKLFRVPKQSFDNWLDGYSEEG